MSWLALWLPLAATAGIALGALLWHHVRPRILAYLDEPRETRRNRRRLASSFSGLAMDRPVTGWIHPFQFNSDNRCVVGGLGSWRE